jgi:hypothetical protein
MEVSGYLHAFGRFVFAKELLVFVGWEVGGPLIWWRRKKCIAFVLVC